MPIDFDNTVIDLDNLGKWKEVLKMMVEEWIVLWLDLPQLNGNEQLFDDLDSEFDWFSSTFFNGKVRENMHWYTFIYLSIYQESINTSRKLRFWSSVSQCESKRTRNSLTTCTTNSKSNRSMLDIWSFNMIYSSSSHHLQQNHQEFRRLIMLFDFKLVRTPHRSAQNVLNWNRKILW